MPSLLLNVDVPDLEKATRFYTEAFGFEVGRRLGPTIVELRGAECAVYLIEKGAGTAPFPGAAEGRRYDRHWTPVHIDLVVDDIEEAQARALGAGAEAEGAVDRHAWGDLALLRDPFGHGICLVQFRGRGYDALATGAEA